MGGVDALVEETTRWYLTWEPEGDIEETIAAGRDGFERLAAVLGDLGSDERRRAPRADRRAAGRRRRPGAAGARPRAAPRAALRARHGLGRGRDRPPDRGGRRGLLRGRRRAAPGLDGDRARARPGDDRGCSAGRCRPCARTPPRCAASSPAASWPRPTAARRPRRVQAFLAERGDARRRLEAFLRSLSREGEPDLAGLTLAVRQLRSLVANRPTWVACRGSYPATSHSQERDNQCPRSSRSRSPRPPPCSPCPSAASAQVPPQCDTAGPVGTRLRHRRQLPHARPRRRASAASRSTCRPTCPPTRRSCSCSTARAAPASSSSRISGWREEADRSGLDRRLPDRPALPDHRDRPADRPSGRTSTSPTTSTRSRRRPPTTSASSTTCWPTSRRAARSTRTGSTPPASPTARASRPGSRSTAPRPSPRSRSPAAGWTRRTRPTRPVPTYATVGTLDRRSSSRPTRRSTELPLDPVQILTQRASCART